MDSAPARPSAVPTNHPNPRLHRSVRHPERWGTLHDSRQLPVQPPMEKLRTHAPDCIGIGRHFAVAHETALPVAMLTTSTGLSLRYAAHRSMSSRRFSRRSERAAAPADGLSRAGTNPSVGAGQQYYLPVCRLPSIASPRPRAVRACTDNEPDRDDGASGRSRPTINEPGAVSAGRPLMLSLLRRSKGFEGDCGCCGRTR